MPPAEWATAPTLFARYTLDTEGNTTNAAISGYRLVVIFSLYTLCSGLKKKKKKKKDLLIHGSQQG